MILSKGIGFAKEGWDGITLTEDYGLGDICV